VQVDALSRQSLELAALTNHWDMALDAGEDQYKLELVVLSLEDESRGGWVRALAGTLHCLTIVAGIELLGAKRRRRLGCDRRL
jgi:hypothetical protein